MKVTARLCSVLGFAALFTLSVLIVPPVSLTDSQANGLYRFTRSIGVNYGDFYIACMILMHLLIATAAFVVIKLLLKLVHRGNVA